MPWWDQFLAQQPQPVMPGGMPGGVMNPEMGGQQGVTPVPPPAPDQPPAQSGFQMQEMSPGMGLLMQTGLGMLAAPRGQRLGQSMAGGLLNGMQSAAYLKNQQRQDEEYKRQAARQEKADARVAKQDERTAAQEAAAGEWFKSQPADIQALQGVVDPSQIGTKLLDSKFAKPEGPMSGIGKLKSDLDNELISQQDYMAELARRANAGRVSVNVAPAPININNPGEKQANAVQTYYGEDFAAKMKTGDGANGRIARLDQMGLLLKGIETGKMTPASLEFKAALKGIGIEPGAIGLDDNVAPLQAAQALAAQIALENRSTADGAGMPGAMSDADRAFLQSMGPNIAQTPEGRAMIMDFAKKVERRKIDVAKRARAYAGKIGALDQGYYDELQTWADANPLAPPTFATDEEADAGVAALPNGAMFVGPDGQVNVKMGAP